MCRVFANRGGTVKFPPPPPDGARTHMLDGRLRATVSRGLTPIGHGLERAGVGPDVLTLLGPSHVFLYPIVL